VNRKCGLSVSSGVSSSSLDILLSGSEYQDFEHSSLSLSGDYFNSLARSEDLETVVAPDGFTTTGRPLKTDFRYPADLAIGVGASKTRFRYSVNPNCRNRADLLRPAGLLIAFCQRAVALPGLWKLNRFQLQSTVLGLNQHNGIRIVELIELHDTLQ
jgi:hypothetical protein